jgi:2-polyprenyl-6-methoxyphenol hydroxylase-like FAD-dependent oxidoreductase
MTHDVLIAGAGPVGLFLSCELRLAGASVLVLEKSPSPASALKGPPFGLRGLSIPTVEALHRRGLLDAIAAAAPARAGGHFAGIPFDPALIEADRWAWRLPGPAAFPAGATMQQIESVLADRAAALGAEIRRGAGLEAVEQSGDGVTVLAGGETFSAGWLVGCDGGRSAVRKSCGFVFSGTDPAFTGYSVQVELADPDALPLGRHYTASGMYFHSDPGTVALVEFDGGAGHRAALTAGDMQAVLRRVCGVDVTVAALHIATTWTDRACQATAYRDGRVLLAGDAAHIHAPLGGQGLNLGLGDAMNLGWKLGAAIRGEAPPGLLDSYAAERHPVGAAVLDWSRAQAALMRPSPGARALEAIVRDLIGTRDGATYFAGRVWGAGLRHDLGGDHPLAGLSAPDFQLADGTRSGERLRNGRGLWLDFGVGAPLAGLARLWADVDYAPLQAADMLGLSAVLVRPDGVVAWASEGPPDLDQAALAAARWFGKAGGFPCATSARRRRR